MRTGRFLFRLTLLFAIAVVIVPALAEEPLPLEQASPFQLADDPYMGDYRGTWHTEGKPAQQLCAQVIALGDGAYRAHLLERFTARGARFATLEGTARNSGVIFEGEAKGDNYAGTTWKGKAGTDKFTGHISGALTGTFTMELIKRLSPTLGEYPPEDAVVLFDGASLTHWVQPAPDPNILDFTKVFSPDHAVAYLRTHVLADAAEKVQFELGSDDGVKVWLNGEQIHANNVSRGVTPGEDTFTASLKAGENTVLAKITQATGGWGFVLRLVTEDGAVPAKVQVAPGADAEPAALTDTKGYVRHWQVSGPYREEGKTGEEIFDVAFAPEEGAGDWQPMPLDNAEPAPCRWKLLENGAMEVHQGGIISKEVFGDHKLHVEFRTPLMPDKRGQERGNSGVYLQGRYEVQVLDSYGLEGVDNECGGIYKVASPRVNMCAPPLQWQTYDITFRAPRFDEDGGKSADATLTVHHNGVLIHEDVAVPKPTAAHVGGDIRDPGPLHLQDHGNPVWFRNIWAVPLDNAE
ncbi:MAG: DUF1080 domain-containing protein [Candidatus Hydrogenedentota bacterium]